MKCLQIYLSCNCLAWFNLAPTKLVGKCTLGNYHFFTIWVTPLLTRKTAAWLIRNGGIARSCAHSFTCASGEVIHLSINCGTSSEFVSSSIPSWQILTAHAQPFRGARDLGFCLKVPLDSLLVWASSGGSGETARMRRLAWTFAAHIGDKYQIRLRRPNYGTSRMGVTRMSLADVDVLCIMD